MSSFARQLFECEEKFNEAQGDNDIQTALDCFEKTYAEAKDTREQCSSLTMLGVGNIKLGRYTAAVNYFLECARIAAEACDTKRRIRAIQFVSQCYQQQGMIEQAKQYEQLAEDILNNLV